MKQVQTNSTSTSSVMSNTIASTTPLILPEPAASPFKPGNNQLTPLGEKIFLDRYALKDGTKKSIAVGDLVIVCVDVQSGQREIGTVVALQDKLVKVELRDGEYFSCTLEHVDKPLETLPEETMARVARGIADVEKHPESWETPFRWLLDEWKFIPGGRILTAAGTDQQLSLFNCYVLPLPHDSRQGIIKTLSEQMEIMSRGGGVGITLSSLRPRHAYVKGVNGRSSGSVSWGALYSFVTGLIEQGGSRRGALMLILDVWHPDILEFINAKRKMGHITNANISVGVSDEFMAAVKADTEWELVFPDTNHPDFADHWKGDLDAWLQAKRPIHVHKKVRARDVWNQLVESAWASAEPGLWFKGRANKMSNSWYFSPLVGCNPCLTSDTWIATSEGPRQIHELIGRSFQSVLEGQPHPSTEVGFWQTSIREVFRLTTQEGYTLRLTSNHLLQRVSTSPTTTQKTDWIPVSQLCVGDSVTLANQRGGQGWTGQGSFQDALHLASHADFPLSELLLPGMERYSSDFYRGWLQGLFNTRATVRVSSASEGSLVLSFAEEEYGLSVVQRMLARLGILSRCAAIVPNPSTPSYRELVISGDNLVVFAEVVGLQHPEKKSLLAQILQQPKDSFHAEPFVATVASISLDGVEPVYDATIPTIHCFDANGILAHNCGEQPLPGYSVCNLGSLNLPRFLQHKEGDNYEVRWDDLRKAVRLAVRFLDNVIDVNHYFIKENRTQQMAERRVGLGTMGIGEMLIRLKIRYGSEDSIRFLDKLYSCIAKEAYLASADIAQEKGSFPLFDKDKFLQSGFMKNMPEQVRQTIRDKGIRNVTLLTQPPTGTTGTMVNTSTGIEPYFYWEFDRKSRLGTHTERVSVYQEWLEKNAPDTPLPDYFVTAMDLAPEEHVKVLAAIQRWVDSAISKTSNLPADYTVEQTRELYEKMYDMGCKGGTIYRDQSRDKQVLNIKTDKQDNTETNAPSIATTSVDAITKAISAVSHSTVVAVNPVAPAVLGSSSASPSIHPEVAAWSDTATHSREQKVRPRPYRRYGATFSKDTPSGTAHITMNDDDEGRPFEVFVDLGKAGSDIKAMAEAVGRLMSLVLRIRSPLAPIERIEEIVNQLKGIGGASSLGFGPHRILSLPDAIGKVLEEHYLSPNSRPHPAFSHTEMNAVSSTQHLAVSPSAGQLPTGQNAQSIQPLPSAHSTANGTTNGTVHGTVLAPNFVDLQSHKLNLNLGSFADICPSCGQTGFIRAGGCASCIYCGHSSC